METLSTTSILLDDVANIVNTQTRNTRIEVADVRSVFLIDMRSVSIKGVTYSITDWAMAQLLNKLGIPYKYLQKCFKESYGLGRYNYSIMANKYAKPVKFKFYNGEIIGVLSDRYTEFSNERIVHIINNVEKLNDMDIKNHKISPQRFHIRMVEKTPILDDLYCGVQVDNSETGKTSLKFRFFVYKQLCTNGLGLTKIESNVFSKKHIGITDIDAESIEKGMEYFDNFSQLAKQTIESSMKDTLTDREMQGVFDTLIARHLLSKQALDSISLNYFVKRYGKTKWAIANIITELSQNFTLDTRLSLEDYAGKLLA